MRPRNSAAPNLGQLRPRRLDSASHAAYQVIDCQTRNLTATERAAKPGKGSLSQIYRVLACVRLARTARRGGRGIDDSEATVPLQRRWVVKRVVKFLPQAPRCRCLRLVVGTK